MSTNFRDLDADNASGIVLDYADPAAPVMDSGEEAFDVETLDDPSLVYNAVQNQVQDNQAEYPRFAMSGLLPIPLYRQNGNNSYGDYNKKNPVTGANDVNFNYYPPYRMMPIVGGDFNVPYENHPTESAEPTKSEAFSYATFMSTPRGGYSNVRRTPEDCAAIFLNETRPSGGHVLACLIGYHVRDVDKGIAAAQYLIERILPVRDRELLPATEREKAGIKFKGPFLDEMLAFVTANGQRRVTEDPNLSDDDKKVGIALQKEIRQLLQAGLNRANQILDETEAEIRDPEGLKRTYDPTNLEVDDAPVSTDYFCLAHTDRVELDNKQLQASKNIGQSVAAGMNDSMAHALETLTDAVIEMKNSRPVDVDKGMMTPEEVQALLTSQRESIMAEVAAMMQQNGVTQTTAPVTDTTPVPATGTKTKDKDPK